jgi:hypothetical protein
MFAPKVVTPQTKATENSTSRLAVQRPTFAGNGHSRDPIEHALFLQRTIGNQATMRLLAQQSSRPDQEIGVEKMASSRGRSGLSWDFSKIPVFSPDRAGDQVLRMPGEPLEPGVRREAERRFGRDFGNVRVHSGPKAAEAVAVVGAPAFTLGRHIVARDGASDPATPEGHAILSHELTHVVQQAAFDDRKLGGAPVLDVTHSSEQEARAGTATPSPIGAPAIQRAPLDIVDSGQQFDVDLTNPKWRQTLDFSGPETQFVYVLRDATTGEILKVGNFKVSNILDRFGQYVTAGNKWSRKLVAHVWPLRGREATKVEAFEAQIRAGVEQAGARLPWDNTRVRGKGPRLGRAGQGIPDTKPQTETEFIDEVEQLRVKHAPPNIPKRRGMSSKKKAKLKAAADVKAAADAKAAADPNAKPAQDPEQAVKVSPEVEQTAGKAGTEAARGGTLPPSAGPAQVESITGKPATPKLNSVSEGATVAPPTVDIPPVSGAGTGGAAARLGSEASVLSSAGRMLAEEAPGLLFQALLMAYFPPEVHIHEENYSALSSQKIDPLLQDALTKQAATLNKLAADDATKSIFATVTVESIYRFDATSGGDAEISLTDLQFIGMKLTREYLLVEGKKFDSGRKIDSTNARNVSRTVTYSVPIFGPVATSGSEPVIRAFRAIRVGLEDESYKVRLSAMLTMFKVVNANPFLTNQLIRDLQRMSKDDDSMVQRVAAHLLSRLKPER